MKTITTLSPAQIVHAAFPRDKFPRALGKRSGDAEIDYALNSADCGDFRRLEGCVRDIMAARYKWQAILIRAAGKQGWPADQWEQCPPAWLPSGALGAWQKAVEKMGHLGL